MGKNRGYMYSWNKQKWKRYRAKKGSNFNAVRFISICVSCFFFLVSTIFCTITLAKYKIRETGDTVVEAVQFIFRSDFACESGTAYDLYADTATIHLYNYDDVNRSDVDIQYSVAVNATDTYSISGTNGVLGASTNNEAVITLSGLKAEKTYSVVITSNSPYEKSLQCSFTVKDPQTQTVCTYDDNGKWGVLKINVGNYNGDLLIDYGSLSPDNTNPLMESWMNTETKTFPVSSYSYYELIFFENTGAITVQQPVVAYNKITISG